MPFVRVPGLAGKVYVPDAPKGRKKKHPCPDCFSCDFCSSDRCQLCRNKSDSNTREKRCLNTKKQCPGGGAGHIKP